MDFYINAAGTAALVVGVSSYLMRSHAALTLTAATGVLLWAVHFYLQAAWTAGTLAVLMSLRVAAGVKVVHMTSRARWVATLVGWALTAGATALTWAGETSVPAAAASFFMAWAGFHLHLRPLRMALLGAEVLWFLNGWVLGSPTAMLAAVVSSGINLTMLLREARPAETTFVAERN